MSRGTLAFLAGTPVGHYKVSALSGLTTGLGAGACIFSASWAGTSAIRALILRLRMKASLVTPFTAANEVNLQAFVARGFTAADSGGTALTMTGLNNVQNSLSDVPSTAAIRVASASAITAGTRTLDANPFATLIGAQAGAAAAAGNILAVEDWGLNSDMQFPFNLQNAFSAAANAEGIVINSQIAQGAAGVLRFAIDMEWIEYGFSTAPGFIG